jgi:hypothetical protein
MKRGAARSFGRSQSRPQPGIEPFADSLYSLLVWLLRERSSGEESASLAHAMSNGKFSKSEVKVQAIARRRANAQLVRVSWSRFRKAYEEYPGWQALALWTQAVIAAQDSVPSWLTDELRKRCPGFIEHEANSNEPKLMGLHLLEWAHNQEFAFAKRECWLDALTFYGVRHPRSECAWAYWESCEAQWSKDRPDTFPAFDEWWKEAQDMMLCDKISYCALGESVEKYLDWEALVLWLRPLFSSNAKLPMHVMSELRRKFPGILAKQNSERPPRDQENSKIWRRLIKWGNDHSLREAKEADSLDLLLQRVQSHPLHVRLVHYGKYWATEWSGRGVRFYPSFREWRLAAHRYIVD